MPLKNKLKKQSWNKKQENKINIFVFNVAVEERLR